MISVVCGSIWKLRNTIIFNQSHLISSQNMIILICSLVEYQSGLLSENMKGEMQNWMPSSFDMISLQSLPPMLMIG
jgi:hypothetical protein